MFGSNAFGWMYPAQGYSGEAGVIAVFDDVLIATLESADPVLSLADGNPLLAMSAAALAYAMADANPALTLLDANPLLTLRSEE